MMDKTQLAALGLFDARVPRYTSYPTALHFSDQVGPGQFAEGLRALAPGARISLYLHIPFCRRLCWFCACRTQGTATGAPIAGYLEILRREIALTARHLPRGVSVTRLHWGGGTPTLLTAAQIETLVAELHGALPIAPECEFSVEIDPNEVDAPRIAALARAGMTRASIGVQDFDAEIQRVIGRPQGYDVTRQTIDMLREAGITSLNTDILFGLPHQTRARIAETVELLLGLGPDRVALYGYAHVPWMAKRQQMIPSDALPRPEERLALFETAAQLFAWDGYRAIGIDHFAQPQDGLAIAAQTGRLRRNFQGYTDDTCDALIGLGASAISRLPWGYAQNHAATGRYAGAIAAGGFATQRGHVFGGEDLLRARMIEMLMCDFRIDRAALHRDFDVAPGRLAQMLQAAQDRFEGRLGLDDTGLTIPPDMRPLTRMIARMFDAYDMAEAGHSSAI